MAPLILVVHCARCGHAACLADTMAGRTVACFAAFRDPRPAVPSGHRTHVFSARRSGGSTGRHAGPSADPWRTMPGTRQEWKACGTAAKRRWPRTADEEPPAQTTHQGAGNKSRTPPELRIGAESRVAPCSRERRSQVRLTAQSHRVVTALGLVQFQQVVGLQHVEESGMSVVFRREAGVGALEVLA